MASEGRESMSTSGPEPSVRRRCTRAWYVDPTRAVIRTRTTCNSAINFVGTPGKYFGTPSWSIVVGTPSWPIFVGTLS